MDRTTVPEAAIDEDGEPRAGERNVYRPTGFPWHGQTDPVPVPCCEESLSYADLGSGAGTALLYHPFPYDRSRRSQIARVHSNNSCTIFAICRARSGGTAFPTWWNCWVRFP